MNNQTFTSSTVNWLERHLRTDIRFLTRGFSWSLFAQFFVSGSSLLLSIIVSHYVSKSAYGEYKYVLSIINIISIFSLNSLGSAVLQSTARGYDGALQDGFLKNIKWSFLIFVGAIGTASYYAWAHNFTLALEILIGGCLTPFITSVNLFSAFLAGKKDFKRTALYQGIFGTAGPVLALIAVAYIAPTGLNLILAYFISNILIDGYFYFHTKKLYAVHDSNKDPEMLSYGKHLSMIGVLSGIAGNIDQFLLFHFVGPIQLAIYSFAIGTLDQIKGPIKTLDSMMQARFASRESHLIHDSLGSKVLIMFIAAIGIGIVYIVIAPYAYHLLFPKYSESIPYTQLYALTLIGIIQVPVGSYFTAKKKVKEQYTNSVVSSIIQIIVMVVGTIGWGLTGLVISRVASSILNTILIFGIYTWSTRKDRKPEPI